MFEEIDLAVKLAVGNSVPDCGCGYSIFAVMLLPLLRREQARQYREEWERRLVEHARRNLFEDDDQLPICQYGSNEAVECASNASNEFHRMHARMLAGERPPEES